MFIIIYIFVVEEHTNYFNILFYFIVLSFFEIFGLIEERDLRTGYIMMKKYETQVQILEDYINSKLKDKLVL